MTGSSDVDDYLAALSEKKRTVMQQLREIVAAAAPEAAEAISYRMPAFKIGDRFFMSYDAFKSHFSLFPWTDGMADKLGDEIKPYLSGKGTLRFDADRPLPGDLIGRIVKIRLQEFKAGK